MNVALLPRVMSTHMPFNEDVHDIMLFSYVLNSTPPPKWTLPQPHAEPTFLLLTFHSVLNGVNTRGGKKIEKLNIRIFCFTILSHFFQIH